MIIGRSAVQTQIYSPRCTPEHSRQMNVPYETEAHCGEGALQSTHSGGSVSKVAMVIVKGSKVADSRLFAPEFMSSRSSFFW